MYAAKPSLAVNLWLQFLIVHYVICMYVEVPGLDLTSFNNLVQLAFLTLCDQALNPPFLGGKMIELGKFCFIKTKFEPNLSCFSK